MIGRTLLHRRIDALLTGEAPHTPPPRPAATAAIRYRRYLPRRRAETRETAPPTPAGPALESLPSAEVLHSESHGPSLLVTRSAPVPPDADFSESRLFFDIEATGLGPFPLFLIGVLFREDDRLVSRLFLARDYSEEGAVIRLFLREAARRKELVSFNGKSYDLPFIRARAAIAGLAVNLDLPHRDLLHESRRVFGDRLPDCRLGTLEREVLGHTRTDDIPGCEIPAAYHEFVRTGETARLVRILDHNEQDLVSLAHLLPLLAR